MRRARPFSTQLEIVGGDRSHQPLLLIHHEEHADLSAPHDPRSLPYILVLEATRHVTSHYIAHFAAARITSLRSRPHREITQGQHADDFARATNGKQSNVILAHHPSRFSQRHLGRPE